MYFSKNTENIFLIYVKPSYAQYKTGKLVLYHNAVKYGSVAVFRPSIYQPGTSQPGTSHLYNIYTTSAQRLRRWSSIVQMLYKCFVFAGMRIRDDYHPQPCQLLKMKRCHRRSFSSPRLSPPLKQNVRGAQQIHADPLSQCWFNAGPVYGALTWH